MPPDRKSPSPAPSASPPVVDIFTRKPFTPKAAPAHDGVAYLDAFVEVEQLEQDQRSLAAAFDAALSRLAARAPEGRPRSGARHLYGLPGAF